MVNRLNVPHFFQYLPYVAGDELIELEKFTQLPGATSIVELQLSAGINVFPNPAREQVHFELNLQHAATASIFLYDLKGQLVDRILNRVQLQAGEQQFASNVGHLASGAYIYSVNIDGKMSSGKMILE